MKTYLIAKLVAVLDLSPLEITVFQSTMKLMVENSNTRIHFKTS